VKSLFKRLDEEITGTSSPGFFSCQRAIFQRIYEAVTAEMAYCIPKNKNDPKDLDHTHSNCSMTFCFILSETYPTGKKMASNFCSYFLLIVSENCFSI
jgi:hypothetical protein